ncbi:HNH endonuclease signature motif containing protein [Myxococcus sp. RHSTA-1-4]|uniref:HNH endonuclease signature motif containing protein n=1 Tax=Myxococcus sp. RHSTA-1-4 TaxID=2874601 RepID=UPI001CBCE31C|nr:HNH endonuclease signature motif containing protein [Myxococcus sp. RHSTA-1-4]MBZ4419051.1 HNH endonuclease [Myxococcus sp. RHSTA-1-4]
MSYKTYTDEELRRVFDSTNGRCHITHKNLSFRNYGKLDVPGGWEVDHSRPLARGGTNHFNNLRPICVRVNRQKQDRSARAMRAEYGKSGPPRSRAQEEKSEDGWNTFFAVLGGVALTAVAAPLGIAVIASLTRRG